MYRKILPLSGPHSSEAKERCTLQPSPDDMYCIYSAIYMYLVYQTKECVHLGMRMATVEETVMLQQKKISVCLKL